MKTHPATALVGVDVAGAHLDVAEHGKPGVRRFANTASGIAQLLRAVPPSSVLGMESTGRYHAPLALAAHAAGLRGMC